MAGHGRYSTSGKKPKSNPGKSRVKGGSGTPKARPGKGGHSTLAGKGGPGQKHEKRMMG
jgi:hypothetical protein